ncbi:MAG: hypothetical protein ACO1TE_13450 [Prosthecobacter sp.]
MKAGVPKTKPKKTAQRKKSRWGEKIPAGKLEAFFADVDKHWGDRKVDAVGFLIKLRRGEIDL